MRYAIGRSTLFLLLLTILFTLAYAGTFRGTIEAGFDSFVEKYSIVEEDTVDTVNEFTSRLGATYTAGRLRERSLKLLGLALLSESAVEIGARSLVTSLHSSFLKVDIGGFVLKKSFRESSTYSYANDYNRYGGRLSISGRPHADLSLKLADAIEIQDFEDRTEFDYDYIRNSLSIGANWLASSGSFANFAIRLLHKLIPDSTEISYRTYQASIEYRKYSSGSDLLSFYILAERRLFAHRPVRSPYWSISSNFIMSPVTRKPWAIVLENKTESYLYDASDDVYFDYTENKSALLFSYRRSYRFQGAIGPLFAFLSGTPSKDDRYFETGIRSEAEFLGEGGSWFSAGYEFGRRRYPYYDDNPEGAIFSDYFFNRFNILGGIKLSDAFGITGFLSHEPVNHKRAGDDTSTTLFSIALVYSF